MTRLERLGQIAYAPGPGVLLLANWNWKRSDLPKPHEGAVRPREVAWLPMDTAAPYTPGPGETLPAAVDFECWFETKSLAACSRLDEPKP